MSVCLSINDFIAAPFPKRHRDSMCIKATLSATFSYLPHDSVTLTGPIVYRVSALALVISVDSCDLTSVSYSAVDVCARTLR